MEKDAFIHDFIRRLRADMPVGSFVIVDHWDADLTAIGIAKPDDTRTLVYVASRESRIDDMYVELEEPPEAGSDMPYQSVGKFEHLTFERVADLIVSHLGIARPSPRTS
jgi:hypothetical protein